MNYFLAQIILVASNSSGEDTFWMQMLILVLLAALVGIGGLIKAKASKVKDQEQHYLAGTRARGGQPHRQIKRLKELKNKHVRFPLKTAQPKVIIEEHTLNFDAVDTASHQMRKSDLAEKAEKDLANGMELLELDFLLSVVENTRGDDKNDVIMRKLSFNELLRRKQLDAADSNVLKVYAMNQGNLYGRDIQCEAMKQLSERTANKS